MNHMPSTHCCGPACTKWQMWPYCCFAVPLNMIHTCYAHKCRIWSVTFNILGDFFKILIGFLGHVLRAFWRSLCIILFYVGPLSSTFYSPKHCMGPMNIIIKTHSSMYFKGRVQSVHWIFLWFLFIFSILLKAIRTMEEWIYLPGWGFQSYL